MRFEDIIPYLGDFGKFQKIQLFLLCLPIWVTGMHALAMTFLAASQEYRCFVPGWDDYSNKTGSLNYSLIFPTGEDGQYDRCNIYAVNVTRGVWYTIPDNTTATEQCNQWVYDTSQYKTSVFSQFNMVCSRKFMNNLAQSMYMAGMLVGAVVFGDLSDRFGRKRLMFISQIIQVMSGIGLAFAPEYITFTILRFMLGAAHSGVFLPAFVIGMEFVTPKGRTMAGICPHIAFAIGYCTLALSAYLIPYWNWVAFVIAVPDLLFLIYYWDKIIPGSARWHLQNGHKEKSKDIIKRAAKVNNKQIPAKVLDELEPDVKHNAHVLAMMRYPRMRVRGFIIFYNWFTVSLVYYGLSLSTSKLPGGNDYLNLSLSGIVEFPGFLFCILLMDRLGRRPCLCMSMIFCGVACIGAGVIPILSPGGGLDWLVITLSMIGKAFTGSAFVLVYNYSAEAFPTVIRNGVVGVSSMFARVGGILAPLVNLMGDYTHSSVPQIIFGIIPLIAGGLALLLPETNNVPMPENLEQGEQFGLPGFYDVKRMSMSLKEAEGDSQTSDENSDLSDQGPRKRGSRIFFITNV
ncbi:organic cation transporter protein isoform X3 [Lingula anatina]|uniref:Organic cation transporter protein isoform X3 n=1 Tax=Lingula anatina TaxID=7574 RepID=A0A1S3IA94_LINAN|nr:organic cation transporter protein isoform X3 [Lingula anatina]|eukprot:XP_013395182.1 organic cation transporter protein isoform X3 [Lingula anatina]